MFQQSPLFFETQQFVVGRVQPAGTVTVRRTFAWSISSLSPVKSLSVPSARMV
jgi:hypothetical protein